jgi:thiosulfate/3-mercaptopyruvate sulfurtransferase
MAAASTVAATPLVDTAWLVEHLSAPHLRIVDLRTARDYQQAHIPQAVHLAPEALVEAQHVTQGRRLSPERFATLMRSLGIDQATTVVAYDNHGSLNATRLWWLLTSYGHAAVQVLNGGWDAWAREKRPVTTDVRQPQPTTFTVREVPERLATKAEVLQALGASTTRLVDARSGLEYRGWQRYAARGGHIPGAVHVEWKQALQPDGTFLPPEALAALLQQAGVSPAQRIITYCQVGVRAAHMAFVLALLGFPDVAVYDGSWAEWGNDPQTPIE